MSKYKITYDLNLKKYVQYIDGVKLICPDQQKAAEVVKLYRKK